MSRSAARCRLSSLLWSRERHIIRDADATKTVYDMTKGVDETLEIINIRLLEKRGGKSGDWVNPNQ